MKFISVFFGIFLLFNACNSSHKQGIERTAVSDTFDYSLPADFAQYKKIKYNFYRSKWGRLVELKFAFQEKAPFKAFFDSTESVTCADSTCEVLLDDLLDIETFQNLESTDFSKDEKHVYYFYSNSGGGFRNVIDSADPASFKPLADYRWGIDKNYVYFQTKKLPELNMKYARMCFPPDTSEIILHYITDSKLVFYEDSKIEGADAQTFKAVSGKPWDAEDKYRKYQYGRIYLD